MYEVRIAMGYDDLTFEFENAEKAEAFASTAFGSIVREEDNEGKLKDVTINISSYMTTKEDKKEEQ